MPKLSKVSCFYFNQNQIPLPFGKIGVLDREDILSFSLFVRDSGTSLGLRNVSKVWNSAMK